ncbi:MAG: hypothetical protein ACREAE_07555 [Nitrosopumilaceae archaeon]
MPIPRKRKDAQIGNISGLPAEIYEKYRADTHVSTVLDDYGVTTLYHLKKKLRGK